MPYSPDVQQAMTTMYHSLREKDRRRYAAVEAAKLGHGGVEYIARLFGCDPKTIHQGMVDPCPMCHPNDAEKKGWTQTADRYRGAA